ncbi:MAG: metallophosphoesterase [Clostridia bacterium]|nr:metallophosphoesterase [Clostridia bacterium]
MKEKLLKAGALDFALDFNKPTVNILLFSDVQIIDAAQQRYVGRLTSRSEKLWATENVEKCAFSFMREAVERIKPDMLVFAGDNVYGEFDDSGKSLERFIAETDGYGIPWAAVFGNHDNETKKGVEWICERYEGAKHCLFIRGDTGKLEGNGNYNAGIFNGGELIEVLWFMDSHGQTAADIRQNQYADAGIMPGQMKWYSCRMETIRSIAGKYPKNIGICHHPFKAFGAGAVKYGYVSARNEFKNGDKEFSPLVIPENPKGDFGRIGRDIGGFIDRDFAFHNLLEKYACEGWFFGHDHEVNASVLYGGVRYTFGLKSSRYDSYNPKDLGSTLITVNGERMSVKHIYSNFAEVDND